MSRIVLGVTGGIAAYKAAALCSALVQRGHEVDVVMSEGAQRFVGAVTFAALSRRPVRDSLWDTPEAIAHIALAREADAIAIVPATANVLAKLALGIADDLLTNLVLATRAPVLVAPAMNSVMYEHPATQGHLRILAARGVTIVPPGTGFLAEREVGVGRLADEETLLGALGTLLSRGDDLAGERVLITAGPTREHIDPVRFLSNASTGTIGIELAREALARGAQVDLVLGPTVVEPPAGARTARVESAQEMFEAVMARAAEADIAIASAAVADWRPVRTFAQKVKKHEGADALELERTPDILATLGERKRGSFLVGFAAETEDLEAHAREKLLAKHLDAIAVNDVSPAAGGFGTGESAFVLLWPGGREDLGRGSKRELARRLWDALLRVRAAGVSSAGVSSTSVSSADVLSADVSSAPVSS